MTEIKCDPIEEKHSEKGKSIPINEVIEHASTVVLASARQVKNGKNRKSPTAQKWETKPLKYTGFKDNKYPTAVVCNEIPEWGLHLIIIDLDSPKDENELPINILKTHAIPIIEKTYCTVTPSGGVHIYLLSKTKPSAQQPRASHNINIDYQANTGIGRGKYIVADYRWDISGEHKEHYLHMAESPNFVAIVDNSDTVLDTYLKNLEKSGHIKSRKMSEINEIIDIFKPYYKEGSRDNYSLAIAGYLKKQGYSQDTVENVINEVFSSDEELSKRVRNVEQTFQKDNDKILGWKFFEEFLSRKDQKTLSQITQTNQDKLKLRISNMVDNFKDPPRALIAAYLQKHLVIYTDPYVHKYYRQYEDGSFREIDDIDIMFFCNDHFGVNKIKRKICEDVFDHFTKPIKKDYDLLEFNNGVLNTQTQEFMTNKKVMTKVPKMRIDLDWNPEAPGLDVERIIDEILHNTEYPDDKLLWFKAVGHAFMGSNRIGKLTIVTGPSGTGKSTLTTFLQRIFNYSQLSTSKICANERFTLHSMIDKDINIDDDINNGILKDIGNLNTVITANGLAIEMKGENRTIQLNNPQIPRLFANGNTLPPVIGEGFPRRLLLIHADKKINYDKRNDTLQNDILNGIYDKRGLEWLVYTAIITWWKYQNEPITTEKIEEQMKEEHDFKSYPLKVAVSKLFKDDYENQNYLPVGVVNNAVKQWCLWAWKNKKISKEHLRPSTPSIKKAMENAGFHQVPKYIRDEDGISKTIKIYEDIEESENFKFIIGE